MTLWSGSRIRLWHGKIFLSLKSGGYRMFLGSRTGGFYYARKELIKLETIISACVSAAAAILVCMISNHSQQEKTRALMEYKLDELTKRVDKHNNVVERTYHLEEEMRLQEEKMKVANHRIDDLEQKG